MKQFGIDVLITFEAGAYVPPAKKMAGRLFCCFPINGGIHIYIAFSVDSLKEEMPWMKGKIFPQMGITKLFYHRAWDPYG